jgi:hypothetical protein
MNKSLSESHPTLWFELDRNGFPMDDDNSMWVFKKVQSCTVDVAEYERLKKELYIVREKTLEEVSSKFDKAIENAVVEGERRALERVENVIQSRLELWRPSGASENRSECFIRCRELRELAEELGEEEKP